MASTYTLRIFHYFVLLIVFTVDCASTTETARNSTDFVGCYKIPIDPDHRPINPGQYNTDTVTVTKCMGLCRDHLSKYTLLNAGEICLCDNSLQVNGSVTNTVCDAMCPKSCGSKDHYSVYSTRSKLGNVNIYRRTLGLKQLSYDDYVSVPTLKDVTFSINFTGTENITLSLDFGDDSPIDNVQKGTPSNFVHLFIRPSTYPIFGIAKDGVTEDVDTEGGVEIRNIVNAVTLISNVSIVCPKVVGANDLFECSVRVMQGTSMLLQADYEVGNITFDLIDAGHTIYGKSASITHDGVTEPDSIYFFEQVMFEGVLVSLEFEVASNGRFTLEVYRPSVIDTKKNCITNGTYNFRMRRCPDDDPWPDNVSVKLIKNVTFIAESSGMYYLILDEEEYLYISKGDMLAVSSTDGKIHRTSNTSHQEYISNKMSLQLKLDRFNTLIQATIVTPSRAKLQMKLPDPIDATGDDVDRIIFVEVKNALSSVNVSSSSVRVQSFVNGIEIIADSYKTTNETVVLSLSEHNGTEVTYEWDFGNGDRMLGAEYKTVEYSWSLAGIYSVKVKAFNNISEDTDIFIITIEDPVHDIITFLPTSPQPRKPDRDVDVTNITEAAMIRWKVLEGTNYFVYVELGTTEKGRLSASPRSSTMEDEMTVDGLTLQNVVLMNEGACLTPLAAVSLSETIIDLNKLCTVLGIVTSAEDFRVSYSNDNHHFVDVAANRDVSTDLLFMT
ncbi:uncharacterized protein LOC117123757 [Anneissia japonica]|uniref:uncharacterized protein LOC117123757 n=1 Tax=Anneissia japonica TaxID=1529436 RepID=UPI001425740F|nr:uncharacterized protein LOC117123757 [Anneissia japonica]